MNSFLKYGYQDSGSENVAARKFPETEAGQVGKQKDHVLAIPDWPSR